MKTKVICHMAVSADGKMLLEKWKPVNEIPYPLFEQVYEDIAPDAWLVGRATGQEYARIGAYPFEAGKEFPRTPWYAVQSLYRPGIILDPHGKLVWDCPTADGDPVIVVLTENIPDSHLAGLRGAGISYIFAGENALDLDKLLNILYCELGIKTLLLQGGAITNGKFFEHGHIDELSLLLFPTLDGSSDTPTFLSSSQTGNHLSLKEMYLTHTTLLENVVWLRYHLSYTNDNIR